MERRGFLQSVGAGFCGWLVGLFAWSKCDAYAVGGARDIPSPPAPASPVERRPGMQLVFDTMQYRDPGPIVAMTRFEDSVMVATPGAVYRIWHDESLDLMVSQVVVKV